MIEPLAEAAGNLLEFVLELCFWGTEQGVSRWMRIVAWIVISVFVGGLVALILLLR